MAFEVVRSRASDRDLDAIFDHLLAACQALGDSLEGALERTAARVRAIEDDMERLGQVPFQGTLRDDLRPGLRQVTKHRAVFYFMVDEAAAEVRVLAVFFGAQDIWPRCSAASGGRADGAPASAAPGCFGRGFP